MSRVLSITGHHQELEILISGWSCDSHTFVAEWGEFTSSLEVVAQLTMLPICLGSSPEWSRGRVACLCFPSGHSVCQGREVGSGSVVPDTYGHTIMILLVGDTMR